MFIREEVYFKSQILVHEYWTILDHFGIPVLFASGTRNVLVSTNTGTFQYLGPEVYFSLYKCSQDVELFKIYFRETVMDFKMASGDKVYLGPMHSSIATL